jgi:methionyl-tRNA synthetase
LVVAIRDLARAIAPIVPSASDALLTLIDAGKGGAPIPQPTPIFPRLELEDEEAA